MAFLRIHFFSFPFLQIAGIRGRGGGDAFEFHFCRSRQQPKHVREQQENSLRSGKSHRLFLKQVGCGD